VTPVTQPRSWTARWNPPWTAPRAKKVARITAFVLASTWLFYVVVANVLIRTNALESMLSRHPDEVRVDWDSASTWWPGRFHTENFRLRTHDSHVEMQLTLSDAHFTLVLSELVSKRVHFTRLEGDGLALRIRQLLDPERATPARLALLPDIEGLPNPPLKPKTVAPPSGREQAILHIEAIDVTRAREVWIDELRYEGDTHVHGGFWFQPTKRLAIDGAHLEVLRGAVHMGNDPVSVGLSGTVDCTVEPFDVRVDEGADVLGHFDAGIHLDGRLESTRWVSYFVNGARSISRTPRSKAPRERGLGGATRASRRPRRTRARSSSSRT
jgi:hypothetical protein